MTRPPLTPRGAALEGAPPAACDGAVACRGHGAGPPRHAERHRQLPRELAGTWQGPVCHADNTALRQHAQCFECSMLGADSDSVTCQQILCVRLARRQISQHARYTGCCWLPGGRRPAGRDGGGS